MWVSWYHGYIQYSAGPQICFAKGHRSSGKKCALWKFTLNVFQPASTLPFVPIWINHQELENKTVPSTYITLSKRAPVFQARLIHTGKGSSQGVIFAANSGTRSTFNSSSVLVHTRAAMRPPALVPVITRGSRPASKNAFRTPRWSAETDKQSPFLGLFAPYSSRTRPLQRGTAQTVLRKNSS